MSRRTWRLGVAGLGVVGGGLLKILAEQPDFMASGDRIEISAISARTRKPRAFDPPSAHWFDDPAELAISQDIDIFVELIGGSPRGRRARR